ncbi:PVC-type heme-binding CxxCH protein [Schlesneria sp. T3-172]|uniref:PVC-type heme-binding CxxCH protein n=1 Tax=Schlesneria sphaerica TaxID=3373610 RepID=UPI0037C63485
MIWRFCVRSHVPSLVLWSLLSTSLLAQSDPSTAASPFGPAKVWTLHLELSEKEYAAMQPPPPAQFGAPPPAAQGTRPSDRNLFGTEFRWAEGNVTAEGKTFKKVGIRYAGDITYLVAANGLKRPLKIEFDRFEQQTFAGLSSIQLHSMPLDPSKAREALAFNLFRALGVPASRTAFAEVTLTVPGRYNREYLGLYTVIEEIDARFLREHFGSDKGLVMKPFRIRGIDAPGENWEAYQAFYRPQREATPEEQQRVIAFAKLVNTASDEEFQVQIGSFIDLDQFLKYVSANALTSNLESFLALGHNYSLYLDPASNRFHFIPGDLEFSFANLLLFGTPDQLMDVSLQKPYPGENKLPDRLFQIPEVTERYRQLLADQVATIFTHDRLMKEIAEIEQATAGVIEKEQAATASRPAPVAPFGPPPGAGGPQPPDLKTFVDKRLASISEQLSGKRVGYVPQPFSFGPPQSSQNAPAINESTFKEVVHVPAKFEATLFAAPPNVSYPVAIACEPTGAVYVAVDEQGSLGRTPGGGRILRCVDQDDDGKVDDVTVFARVEHPRGVTYRNGKVWVMHPPDLTVFQDLDGDGIAESSELLVTGLTTDQITERGGDHTTNCVRMGIDGWLYIGVGDYGIKEAQGKDGRKIVLRGGGVVRVRPDGTELEIYCRGLRNPFDLAIDPFLNLFTRDNTNDGAGWDTRVSLLKQSALYGYTQLFANFTDETMPTLGTFGNSGGTGGLFIQDPRWPEPYQDTLLTGDWGRSEVYRHALKENGPTFDLEQEVFIEIPRATGMDMDGNGRLYVASWRGGEASVFAGPNIGFVARVTPRDMQDVPFPDLNTLSVDQLIEALAAPQSVTRLHAQGEILSRGRNAETTKALIELASSDNARLEGRVAAVWTLKQLDGNASHVALGKLAEIAPLRESVLRALTDRSGETAELDPQLFVDSLNDPSPRVRAQAVISLGRLNCPETAASLLPLTMRSDGSVMPTQRPLQNQPDPGRVIPHLAVQALVQLQAVETCLEGLDGPSSVGALWVLRSIHQPRVVDGLIRRLATARTEELRNGILTSLIRLYHREADYDGSWWGIRPDNSGPYYDRVEWEMSSRIAGVITNAAKDSDPETVSLLKRELRRHGVEIAGISSNSESVVNEPDLIVVVPKADPANGKQLGNMSVDSALAQTLLASGDARRGEALFKTQACAACHTTADGQTPKGPHLFEIGKRYQRPELAESILKPSAKLAQGYESYQFVTVDGRTFAGFVVSERADATIIREADGRRRELKKGDVEERLLLKVSAMPEGIVANLTAEQFADLIEYLCSLK